MLSPDDDFANFEVLNYLLADPAGRVDHQHGSYIREALRNGLGMAQARGYNPYKFGIVSGSDSHNTGVPYRQDNFSADMRSMTARCSSAWPATSSLASTCAWRIPPA